MNPATAKSTPSPVHSRPLNILLASLTGPASSPAFYEKALRKRHNVITFGPYRDESHWQSYGADKKRAEFYRAGTAEHWTDVCSRLSRPCDIVTAQGMVNLRELKAQLPSDFKPDLLIWIDQHGWNLPIVMEALNCPSVALFGDTHLHMREDWQTWLAYAREFDFVFLTFNKHHMRHFSEAGCKRVFWSPAACDPEINCRIKADKIYPVSFVGGTYPQMHEQRVALLHRLINAGIDIHIDSKILQEMSLIFSRSKIVLNTTMTDDVNMRIFEALASGSLLLTNRLPSESGLEELFVDKRHLVLYDLSGIEELIHYYLENDEERERIAAAGHFEVLKDHTYEHRVQEIIRIVETYLS